MALVLIEGFDHYKYPISGIDSQLAMKGWGGTPLGQNAGRFPYGPQSQSITAAIINNGINKNLPSSYLELYIGFGFLVTSLGDVVIFSLNFGNGLGVGISSAGVLTLYDALGNIVASGTTHFFPNNWHYCECHFTQTHGEVHLDGLSEIASTAGNFGGSYSNVSFHYQRIGADSLRVDDMYVLDTTTGTNNTFLGDTVVETLYPISDGTHKDWTPDTGTTHYVRVDEYILNEDTSYVHTTTAGNEDSYDIGNPTLAATPVFGVQLNLGVRKNDAGTRTIDPLIRQSGTDYLGTTQAVTAQYQFLSQIYNHDPTGTNWTYSTVNGDEYGIKLVS